MAYGSASIGRFVPCHVNHQYGRNAHQPGIALRFLITRVQSRQTLTRRFRHHSLTTSYHMFPGQDTVPGKQTICLQSASIAPPRAVLQTEVVRRQLRSKLQGVLSKVDEVNSVSGKPCEVLSRNRCQNLAYQLVRHGLHIGVIHRDMGLCCEGAHLFHQPLALKRRRSSPSCLAHYSTDPVAG